MTRMIRIQIGKRRTFKELLGDTTVALEKRYYQRQAGVMPGVPTGLADLDALTSGLQPGRVYIFGARPKMGKSSLVRQMVLNVAKETPVLYHSLEMSDQQSAEAILVNAGRFDAKAIGMEI